MKKSDKFTVLVLVIIVCLGFGGCQVQVGGKGNRQVMGRKVQGKTYHERLVSGEVSIMESIERAHRGN